MIPRGLDRTIPAPEDPPLLVTESGYEAIPKIAVTDCAEFIVRTHGPLPVQLPDHPINADPVAADGVRVTTELYGNVVVHEVLQESPAGVEETEPAPTPAIVIARAGGSGGASRAALSPQHLNSPSLRIAHDEFCPPARLVKVPTGGDV